MSAIYHINGHDVWEPGTLTSLAFLGQCRLLADVLELPCGLHNESDEVRVDPAQLEQFCIALKEASDRCCSQHFPNLVRACEVTCLFLLSRATSTGWQPTQVDPKEVTRARDLVLDWRAPS